MVFWSTVLAFIIGIMTYVIYPRGDQIETVHMPASEAYISGFVAQHQAAKDYLREALIALNKLSGNVAASHEDGSVLVLSGEKDGHETSLVNFMPMLQTISTSSDLKPKSGFVSVLGCFSHPERKYIANSGSGTPTAGYMVSSLKPCASETAQTKYVFTYGPLPDETSMPYMRNKILLWEAAILRRTHGSPDCGFLQKKGDGRYYINNSSRLTRTIPTKFIEKLSDYITVAENKRVMVEGEDGKGNSYSVPLLFCMTPANDPYPRAGLVANYDSLINTGEAGVHATLISENDEKWVNLGNGVHGETLVDATIEGDDQSWFLRDETLCEQVPTHLSCQENVDKGFSFNNNRFLKTGIRQKSFGSSFTLSFMGRFDGNHGTYGVFGTEYACTPTAGYPCLTAEYDSNINIFRVKLTALNNKVSVLAYTVQPNTITQIDYIVNPGGHKLFVDGKQVQEDTFSSSNTSCTICTEISGLADTEFVIGRSADWANRWKGVLYNFLLYKQSLSVMPDMTAAGNDRMTKFDVKGLARIHKTNTDRYNYQK